MHSVYCVIQWYISLAYLPDRQETQVPNTKSSQSTAVSYIWIILISNLSRKRAHPSSSLKHSLSHLSTLYAFIDFTDQTYFRNSLIHIKCQMLSLKIEKQKFPTPGIEPGSAG